MRRVSRPAPRRKLQSLSGFDYSQKSQQKPNKLRTQTKKEKKVLHLAFIQARLDANGAVTSTGRDRPASSCVAGASATPQKNDVNDEHHLHCFCNMDTPEEWLDVRIETHNHSTKTA